MEGLQHPGQCLRWEMKRLGGREYTDRPGCTRQKHNKLVGNLYLFSAIPMNRCRRCRSQNVQYGERHLPADHNHHNSNVAPSLAASGSMLVGFHGSQIRSDQGEKKKGSRIHRDHDVDRCSQTVGGNDWSLLTLSPVRNRTAVINYPVQPHRVSRQPWQYLSQPNPVGFGQD